MKAPIMQMSFDFTEDVSEVTTDSHCTPHNEIIDRARQLK
jgi:hypothetical protein